LKEGRVRKLAPTICTTNVTEAPELLVRRQLWQLASLVFPDAVITDRTAFEAGASKDGSVFLAARTARDVALPGVTLRAREGAGPLAGDTPFLRLHMASRARAYLENIPPDKLGPAWEAEQRSPTSSKHLATTGSLRGYIHLVTHEELLARITINPAVCHGKPCIRGHRIWVGLVLGMLEGGMRQDEILSEYPSLEPADIQACLAYASE
jgi:uncharacterized protein (DUF433 family)